MPPPLPVGSHTVETDGSFPGLLCAFADAHRFGALPASVELAGAARTGGLFGAPRPVATDVELADRVERRLEARRPGLVSKLFRAVLSERSGIEVTALRLAAEVVARGPGAVDDWTFEPARDVARWSQRVGRERHRMEAFVRFERHTQPEGKSTGAEGDRWLAHARPEHHVLPLLHTHFAARYPALPWTILDVRRHLALVHTPATDASEAATRVVPATSLGELMLADDETAYQRMWRAYFQAVDIPERRNLRLHLRHVPKRYWPYLTEKRDGPA